MRIHLCGNILNWAYQFGGYLRALGHDVRVFVSAQEPIAVYRPEWEQDDADTVLPEWVEPVDVRFSRVLVPGREERRFLRQLADCDVIQTFGEYAVWAWRTCTPYVVLSYGGDLEILPFARGSLKEVGLAVLVRRALRGADALVYAIPSHRTLVQQLGIETARFNPHAVPIDTDRWAPIEEAARRRLRARYPQRLVFFHGARQEWTFKDANDKANDRLFRGFARFVREDRVDDSLLIAVERGRDVERSKALVASLGVADRVVWIKELRKAELITMLRSVDVFFDQFSHGYFGVATLEALACGVPTCLRLSLEGTEGIDLPPVFNVSTEDDIVRAMHACRREDTRAAMRGASREWAVARHDWRVVMEWYLELYRGVPRRRRPLGASACA